MLNSDKSSLENSVDQDLLVMMSEANWSEPALFCVKPQNLLH